MPLCRKYILFALFAIQTYLIKQKQQLKILEQTDLPVSPLTTTTAPPISYRPPDILK